MTEAVPPVAYTYLVVGDIRMNLQTKTIFVRGTRILFEAREVEYLAYFMRNPGRVISPEEILDAIYPPNSGRRRPKSDLVKSMVRRIRAKIEPYIGDADYFTSYRGRGYWFQAP